MRDNAIAYMYLSQISRQKRELVSLCLSDFEAIQKLIGFIPITKNVKNSKGETVLLLVNKKVLVKLIKEKYKFLTIREAEEELQETYRNV